MASEVVTVAVALASPTAAATVAIVMHRQRLAHERRQTDLAAVRERLARATAAAKELDHASIAWDGVHVAGLSQPRTDVRERLEQAIDSWRGEAATLIVLFTTEHGVAVAVRALENALIELDYYLEDFHERDGAATGVRDARIKMRKTIDGFILEAREVAQATL